MNKYISSMLCAAAVGTAFAAFDCRLEVTHYSVNSNRLPPEFDNFKIAHISDCHGMKCPKGLLDVIVAASPDIIVVTGDLANDAPSSSTETVLSLMSSLVKIAPCFAVSGNHDTWRCDYPDFVMQCKKIGVHFLQNETYMFSKGNASIAISGMEDVFTKVRAFKKTKESLRHFSETDEYQILLFHRANALDAVKDFGFDLILSGHLHGGQIRLPFVGGLFSPLSSMTESESVLFPKYCCGLHEYKNTKMIINRGLGNPIIVPRIFNRPELGIITLRNS